MVTKILAVILLLTLLTMPSLAYANSLRQGGVILGSDFIVHSGERVEGAVVLGGDVGVEHGGTVEGDLAAVGGDVTIAGDVTGSLIVIGGDLHLAESAFVGGDVIAPFANIERAPGAEVQGQIFAGQGPQFIPRGEIFRFRELAPWREIFFAGFLGNIFQTILTILGAVALGILAVVLVPGPMVTVRNTLIAQPAPSLGLGFLAILGAIIVLALLVITCIGIPLAIILGAVLGLAAAFGWVTVGLLGGERLLTALQSKEKSPVIAVTLGTLLITLVAHLPCLGFLFFVGISSWGLGAVLLTRFGTKSYP